MLRHPFIPPGTPPESGTTTPLTDDRCPANLINNDSTDIDISSATTEAIAALSAAVQDQVLPQADHIRSHLIRIRNTGPLSYYDPGESKPPTPPEAEEALLLSRTGSADSRDACTGIMSQGPSAPQISLLSQAMQQHLARQQMQGMHSGEQPSAHSAAHTPSGSALPSPSLPAPGSPFTFNGAGSYGADAGMRPPMPHQGSFTAAANHMQQPFGSYGQQNHSRRPSGYTTNPHSAAPARPIAIVFSIPSRSRHAQPASRHAFSCDGNQCAWAWSEPALQLESDGHRIRIDVRQPTYHERFWSASTWQRSRYAVDAWLLHQPAGYGFWINTTELVCTSARLDDASDSFQPNPNERLQQQQHQQQIQQTQQPLLHLSQQPPQFSSYRGAPDSLISPQTASTDFSGFFPPAASSSAAAMAASAAQGVGSSMQQQRGSFGRQSNADARSRQSTGHADEMGSMAAIPGSLTMSRRGSAGAEDDEEDQNLDPDEMSKKDPLATQVWKMYAKQKSQLPNGARMENLTWRMMAMTLRKKKEQEAAEAKLALEAPSNASTTSQSHASSARHSPTLSSKSAAGSRRSSGSFPGDAFAGAFTAIQPTGTDSNDQQSRAGASAAKGKARFAEVIQQEEQERGRRGRSPRTPESTAPPAGAVDIVDWRMKSKSRSRSRSVSAMDVDWRGVSRSRSVHRRGWTPSKTRKRSTHPTSSAALLPTQTLELLSTLRILQDLKIRMHLVPSTALLILMISPICSSPTDN